MNSLSVIIITKNEASRLRQCLAAAQFAQEIIVVDSASTDETVKIAAEFTDHIYNIPWQGFGPQKNIALSKASCEWILSLDADEIICDSLKEELIALLSGTPQYNAYFIPRRSSYCQQTMIYGDWKNEKCLRLFKRGMGQFKNIPIHEQLIVPGQKGLLKNHLIHNSFPKMEDVLEKVNRYSTLSAVHRFKPGKKVTLFTAITHGIWTFLRGYFFKLGFLDGKKGFMLAVSNAEGCYYRYIKMMLMNEEHCIEKKFKQG